MTTRIVFFDGGDGTGKTTQIDLAKSVISKNGHSVYATRLMGGSDIGEALRTVMLSESKRPPETDMHMALATYYALYDKLKSLHDVDIVLIDRSPLSIIAYQSYGSKIDLELAKTQVDIVFSKLQPDLIIVYDAEASSLQTRREHRNNHQDTDYFESKSIQFHQAVAEGYRIAAQDYGAKLINANQSVDEIHEQTLKLIEPLLKPTG